MTARGPFAHRLLLVASSVGLTAGAPPPDVAEPLFSVVAPPPASTEVRARLAVLPVLVEGRRRFSATDVYDAVERSTDLRPLDVAPIDEYFFQDGRELSARALRCGGDTQCLARAMAAFRADLGLVVLVNEEVEPPLLGLVLLETDTRTVRAERYDTLTKAPLRAQIVEASDRLFRAAGIVRRGRLQVHADPADALVIVAGDRRPDLGTEARFTLPPGTYPVRVSAPNHKSKEEQVEIRSGVLTELELKLEQNSESLWSSPVLWLGIGAAAAVVAGSVAGIVLASQSNSDCLCINSDEGMVCLSCQ